MKLKLAPVEGAVAAPQGFRTGGVFCDIKRLGTGKGSDKGQKLDLALIVSDVPCAVAGLFTTNQVCAAPVKVCVPRTAKGIAQAVVVNSGNANACTGRQGMKDAREMVRLAEKALGIADGFALVGSTGRIGRSGSVVARPSRRVAGGARGARGGRPRTLGADLDAAV
jgi:glutamate N-acetyltransferase/amino-acid N-acetyltransferase